MASIQSLDSTRVRKDSARAGQRSAVSLQLTAPSFESQEAERSGDDESTNQNFHKKNNGRADPLPFVIQKIWPLFSFIDYLLEFVTGSEFRDSAGSNFDCGTRLWVPAIAGFSLRDGKRAESN
jgi:hypothetical protein